MEPEREELRGGGSSLPAETIDGLCVLGNGVRQELQSDVPAQAGVAGFVNHGHSTATELFDDLIMRDRATN